MNELLMASGNNMASAAVPSIHHRSISHPREATTHPHGDPRRGRCEGRGGLHWQRSFSLPGHFG